MAKYLFISGGVCSSLGKGILASSIANLIESRNFKISMIKIDPYINVDAGTISPYQHGEVFVTKDGAETDLDLGNYYRFTNIKVEKRNSITTGQIYQDIISKERRGDFLGKTVQMIPHLTDVIMERIEEIGEDNDIVIIEIGGTVGDYESIPFLEATRQMILKNKKEDIVFIHMTLIPEVSSEGIKTKPTQHSVKELRSLGIQPDIIVTRLKNNLSLEGRKKISLFTNVKEDLIFFVPNVEDIYEVPIVIKEQYIDEKILQLFNIKEIRESDTSRWEKMLLIFKDKNKEVLEINLVGKYADFEDSYKSLDEALKHAGIENNLNLQIKKIDSSLDDSEFEKILKNSNGILIPGGFGVRGIGRKIEAIRIARENNIPILGICLGMHLFFVEYAQNILKLEDANSTEFDRSCKNPVISLLKEQYEGIQMGGTMRLGAEKVYLKENTKIKDIYQDSVIEEIHRHRYEFNNQYKDLFEETQISISAYSRFEDLDLVEAIEYKDHPWGIAVQFHPEFLSKPLKATKLFKSFVRASFENRKKYSII